MPKATVPTLYKGAGPGTHWHLHDARVSGFTAAANNVATRNAVVTHIVAYSHPSPMISLTTSFAVARRYGLSGPGGIATAGNPGFVYEIDFSSSSARPPIRDPVGSISKTVLSHAHGGDQDLVVLLAQNQPILPVPHAGGASLFPTVPRELRALVYALRDGEVLADVVAQGFVVNRHPVY